MESLLLTYIKEELKLAKLLNKCKINLQLFLSLSYCFLYVVRRSRSVTGQGNVNLSCFQPFMIIYDYNT